MKVYFILDRKSKAIKIGKANNINQRLSDLQTCNPNELEVVSSIDCKSEKASFDLEFEFHKKFKSLRIRENGEWFHYNEQQFEEVLEEYTNSQEDKNSRRKKNQRDPISIQTVYNETLEFFGVKNSPPCYFYHNHVAHIITSFKIAMKMKFGKGMPFRTMSWPTYGKRMLLPYSHEVDRVFISDKKYRENRELARFTAISTRKPNTLDKFIQEN